MPKASRKELRKELFKKGVDARDKAKKESKEKHDTIEAAKPPKPPPQKRYILFVGNLPYDITEEQLKEHFKNTTPSNIRLRSNGIAFLEFAGEHAAAQLHHALQYHHTNIGKRRINVEFSAGGGGNSKHRRDKIKQKNANFQEELKQRQKSEPAKSERRAPQQRSASPAGAASEVSAEDAAKSGINPARLAALRNR